MRDFYNMLTASAGNGNPYLHALRAITRFSPAELTALGEIPGWHVW